MATRTHTTLAALVAATTLIGGTSLLAQETLQPAAMPKLPEGFCEDPREVPAVSPYCQGEFGELYMPCMGTPNGNPPLKVMESGVLHEVLGDLFTLEEIRRFNGFGDDICLNSPLPPVGTAISWRFKSIKDQEGLAALLDAPGS